MCACGRKIIIKVVPPKSSRDNGNIVSHDELCRRLGLPTVTHESEKRQVAGESKTTGSDCVKRSLTLSKDEAALLREAVAHYGKVFKQGSSESTQYIEFAGKIKHGELSVGEDEEIMIRCALSERNINRLWPVGEFDDDDSYNVKCASSARALMERLVRELDAMP
jgi:hypothetical protein